MPTHMNIFFSTDELRELSLTEPFQFSKGCRTLKIKSNGAMAQSRSYHFGLLLFDLNSDPQQPQSLENPSLERQMENKLISLMIENEAPDEQFERLGLLISGE